MKSLKDSPYRPHPDDPDVVCKLVFIKDAAAHFECSADTLRNNAKARRFPAYQAANGAPVFVTLEEAGTFLKTRPDIDSVFRKNLTKSPTLQRLVPRPVGEEAVPSSVRTPAGPATIHLASLANIPSRQFALVADCLEEISLQLRAAISATEDCQKIGVEHQPGPPPPSPE